MTRHRLVVRPHRPLRNGVLYTLVAVLTVTAVLGAFEFGRVRAGYDSQSMNQELTQQRGEIERLEAVNSELRERIALLERSGDIDSEARQELQATLATMQDEVLELREELAFYRGIVSPDNGAAGLRVQSLRIQPGPDRDRFHFRLVLIQAIKHDRRASGEITVAIHGQRGGEAVSLQLSDLVMNDADKLSYSFKYFQDFEGDFRLPDNFQPQRVEVTVSPSGRGNEPVSRSFAWDDISA